MIRKLPLRSLASASAALALLSAPGRASAQAAPLSEAIVVGAWTFRPSLEVRIRDEYRRHPVDTGGRVYASTAVLADGYGKTLPDVVDSRPPVGDQFWVSERTRLGIQVDRGPATAVLVLQDARALGDTSAALVGPGEAALPSLAPHEAYVDLHTRSGRRAFFRLGRQRVTWGDGRLVGESDWSYAGRYLDAARAGVQIGDLDLEAMGAILAAPGNLPPAATGDRAPSPIGAGAQLYGLDAVWRIFPLLNAEIAGLARIVRGPYPSTLTPSDTYVADARVFGDRRGFRYAVEGAYELGRVASYGVNRDLRAFALAARASLETALPWHLTFGAEGAFASGDDGNPSGTQKRFDPILPDEHTPLGPMGVFAWSNILTGGGWIGARSVEDFEFRAGYRIANLASKQGRWTTEALIPVGSSAVNTSSALGHEIDWAMKITPWKPLEIDAGYGLFAFGDGAREILREVGRPAKLEHWVYLQTTLRMP